MQPTIHVPPLGVVVLSRMNSCDTLDDNYYTTFDERSTASLVLSGLDDGSPLSISPRHFGGCRGSSIVLTAGGSAATTPTSKVDLFGEQTLPSPLMKLSDHAFTKEGLQIERRHERTPPPERQHLSRSFSYSSEDEIIGDIIGPITHSEEHQEIDHGMVVPEIFGDMDFESERPTCYLYGDRGVSRWFTMSDSEDGSFVATTTGASVGKLTPHTATTPHSARSDANGLFSGQRSYQRGSGLFDSHELSSSVREMVALDVPSLTPLHRSKRHPS